MFIRNSRPVTRTRTHIYALIAAVIAFATIRARAQDIFYQPATGYSNVHNVNSTPGMAFFNGVLYVAYQDSATGDLSITTSSNEGSSFSNPVVYSSVAMGSAPALAVFDGVLYVAYKAAGSADLMMTYTSNGSTFATPFVLEGLGNPYMSGVAPALAAFDGQLWIAWVDYYTSTIDYAYTYYPSIPADWPGNGVGGPGPGTGISLPPAMAVWNNTLFLSYQDTTSHKLVVQQWIGNQWSDWYSYPGILMGSGPAMATAFNGLVVGFKSNDKYNWLFNTVGESTSSFSSPAYGYSEILMKAGPGMTADASNIVYVAFQSNDSYHWLFMTKGSY
jgi:hypothetical protein